MNYEQLYLEAEMVAARAHQNQGYDIFPYTKHLRDTVDTAKRFGHSGDILIACWLHDSIEDGNLTYNKIKGAFGINAAELVLAVTDPIDCRTRKEKKAKVYQKILACGEDALIVKLADRIANVEHGKRMGNDIVEMYEKEYLSFRNALYNPDQHRAEAMWKHLDKIFESVLHKIVAA